MHYNFVTISPIKAIPSVLPYAQKNDKMHVILGELKTMKQHRHDALSIPNLITYFRLLLIPLFIWAYFRERYDWSLAILVMSGLSDIADGYIARHYHMITDIGKIVDPVADKLTQAAMFFCAAWKFPAIWILFGFLAFKEIVMLFWGWYALRRTGTVNSAKWYGKVCTGVLYASMAALVLFPGLSEGMVDVILLVCGGVMLMSLILYSRWYILFLREKAGPERTKLREHDIAQSRTSPIVLGFIAVVLLVSVILTAVFLNGG